ncbi:MFS transporter [Rhizobium sp. BK251]|uniref:MFS transporter n=1 Tax=Rhizobium sp. BK251 TaxID=2512125 RepID=UPI0010D87412|nr:MFS transporter [Rhizobium sp. BK251]TCL71761.1 putative MFS family arabinose efflux permease [Rhizobium sp. BK251]
MTGTDFAEFRNGWQIVLAGLLGTALGLPAIPFYTIGVFAPILAKEFGWSFAAIFGGLSLLAGSVLIIGPFFATLIDKFGARLVASTSLPCLGLSYMTLAASNGSIGQYYLSWLAIAIFGLGATPVVFTRVINSAFEERRGLALGIALSGAGLFAFVVKPLAQLLIETGGWRVAILVVGAMPILVACPMVLWGFAGLRSRNMDAGPTPGTALEGMTAREAFRSRSFWLLAIVFIPMSLAVAAPLPNIENILRSLRLSPTEVVQLASLVGIAAVAGRLLGGVLVDRFWAPAVGTAILTLGAVACLILSLDDVSFSMACIAILLLGLVSGVEFDLMAYLVSRYLGMRSYATTYATLYGIFVVGAFVGPSLFGYAFDSTGTYSGILEACALLLIAGATVILFLGPYPLRKT